MQNFATPAPISAVVEVTAGTVRFVAADRPDTTVDVRPADAGKGRDVKAAQQTTVTYADGVLRVTTPVKHTVLGASGAVAVTVELPAGSRVRAAQPAEVQAVGRFDDVTVEGSFGAVTVDEASSVRISALAGDVTVGRVTGRVDVSTSKGDIRVTEAVHGAVTVTTQAGDITVDVPDGVTASLDAGTSMGRIENALTRGGGTPDVTIRATTSLGDIAARTR